jgi:hypothetical protein
MCIANFMHFQLLGKMKSPDKWGAMLPLAILSIMHDLSNKQQSDGASSSSSSFFIWLERLYKGCAAIVIAFCVFEFFVHPRAVRIELIMYETVAWVVCYWMLPFAFPKMNHQLYTYLMFISRFLQAYIVAGVVERVYIERTHYGGGGVI